jgi:PKD repeat protein
MRKIIFFVLCTPFFITSCKKNEDSDIQVKPVANFTFSGTSVAPAQVQFTNTSTNASTYSWDFGDNSAASSATSPTYTYSRPGTYTIRLKASNANTSDSISKSLTIQAPTSVRITSVRITSIPLVDPTCNCAWDNNNGPDVYYELTETSNNVLVSTIANPFNNVVASDLPITWNLSTPYQINDFLRYYRLQVYDKDTNDTPSSNDDFINGFLFNFNEFITSGYPSSILLESPSHNLKVVLNLQWQ